MKQKKHKEVKFPENLRIAGQLKSGDRKRIAVLTGYSVAHIYDVFQGDRRITDKIAKATVQVYNERRDINISLEKIANQ
jgi:hypothetical protein